MHTRLAGLRIRRAGLSVEFNGRTGSQFPDHFFGGRFCFRFGLEIIRCDDARRSLASDERVGLLDRRNRRAPTSRAALEGHDRKLGEFGQNCPRQLPALAAGPQMFVGRQHPYRPKRRNVLRNDRDRPPCRHHGDIFPDGVNQSRDGGAVQGNLSGDARELGATAGSCLERIDRLVMLHRAFLLNVRRPRNQPSYHSLSNWEPAASNRWPVHHALVPRTLGGIGKERRIRSYLWSGAVSCASRGTGRHV